VITSQVSARIYQIWLQISARLFCSIFEDDALSPAQQPNAERVNKAAAAAPAPKKFSRTHQYFTSVKMQ
jgi:hypothetical protein